MEIFFQNAEQKHEAGLKFVTYADDLQMFGFKQANLSWGKNNSVIYIRNYDRDHKN